MVRQISYSAVFEPPVLVRGSALDNHCYLCGSKLLLTKEHVIPKTLFTPSINNHPLILKACSGCNTKKSLDDQYFVRTIQGTSFNNAAQEGIANSINKQKARQIKLILPKQPGGGLYQNMLNNAELVDVKSTSGLYFGKTPILKLELTRIKQYIEDIAKGLWSANVQRIMNWENYEIKSDIHQAIQNTKYFYEEPFAKIWKHGKYGQRWQHYFSYRGDAINNTWASSWVMVFYSSHVAVVTIFDKRKIDVIKSRANLKAKS